MKMRICLLLIATTISCGSLHATRFYPNLRSHEVPMRCSCGYLVGLGPSGWRHLPPTQSFDRTKLIPIGSIEKEIFEETKAKHSEEDKILDTAHEANVEIVKEGQEDTIVASPVVFIEEETVAQEDNSSFDPNELLLYIEKEIGDPADGKKASFPFQLPYQEAASPIPVPSQSIYERK